MGSNLPLAADGKKVCKAWLSDDTKNTHYPCPPVTATINKPNTLTPCPHGDTRPAIRMHLPHGRAWRAW